MVAIVNETFLANKTTFEKLQKSNEVLQPKTEDGVYLHGLFYYNMTVFTKIYSHKENWGEYQHKTKLY